MSLIVSPTLNSKNIILLREKQGLPVYNFGLGENMLPPPKELIDAIAKFSSKKQYIPVSGITDLNQQIKKLYSNNYYHVDNVIFGNGLKELLFLIQLSFDGIIFHITPSWVSYEEQIKILNKQNKLVQIHTTFEKNYKVTSYQLDKIFKKYNNSKKLIIFNNPNNPTGIMYNKEEIVSLGHMFHKHNCIVFADEIYKNIHHFNEFYSISNIIPHLTIRGNSVSKDLACGGYRLGWITFPKELFDLYNLSKSIASSIYSCSCVPIQYGLNHFLQNPVSLKNYLKCINDIYLIISNIAIKHLKNTKLLYINPNSSWYIFLDFRNYSEKLKKYHNIDNSIDLVNMLTNEIGFVSVAGKYFGHKGLCMRISLIDIDISRLNFLSNKESDIELSCHRIIGGLEKLTNFLNTIK